MIFRLVQITDSRSISRLRLVSVNPLDLQFVWWLMMSFGFSSVAAIPRSVRVWKLDVGTTGPWKTGFTFSLRSGSSRGVMFLIIASPQRLVKPPSSEVSELVWSFTRAFDSGSRAKTVKWERVSSMRWGSFFLGGGCFFDPLRFTHGPNTSVLASLSFQNHALI